MLSSVSRFLVPLPAGQKFTSLPTLSSPIHSWPSFSKRPEFNHMAANVDTLFSVQKALWSSRPRSCLQLTSHLDLFTQDQTLSKDLLQPSSPLDIPGRLTVNWKVRAFIVQSRVFASNPLVQVLFYIAGRDWDDFKIQDKLPCVRLHAFRDVREIKTSCRLQGNLAQCLAQLDLPSTWFNVNVAPLGRRKSSGTDGLELSGETLQVELYYTLHDPDINDECGESYPRRGGASRGESSSQQPLLRIGSISLYQPSQEQLVVDKQLDKNLFLRLPERPLKPGETLSIYLLLVPNSTVEQFTLK